MCSSHRTLLSDQPFLVAPNDLLAVVFDFEAMKRYRQLDGAVVAAPPGPQQQAAWGRLFLDRGIADWALEAFLAAQSQGQPVSALELARAAWKAGDLPTAEAQFRQAIRQNLEDVPYLQACLQAVKAAGKASPLPIGGPPL